MLLDHFCPPLSTQRHWHSFHNAWATYIAADLNQRLPAQFFAEPNVQYGVEIDVAAFQAAEANGSSWQPPEPDQQTPFELAKDVVEISVFNREAGPILRGAIELVSPANKDRLAHRDAFVAKCVNYLRSGISLIVVDVVTNRCGNLHNALLTQLDLAAASVHSDLYATAY